jgi:selenide,water dikinase
LLLACAPDAVAEVLDAFRATGFEQATIIGNVQRGEPTVQVSATGG